MRRCVCVRVCALHMHAYTVLHTHSYVCVRGCACVRMYIRTYIRMYVYVLPTKTKAQMTSEQGSHCLI